MLTHTEDPLAFVCHRILWPQWPWPFVCEAVPVCTCLLSVLNMDPKKHPPQSVSDMINHLAPLYVLTVFSVFQNSAYFLHIREGKHAKWMVFTILLLTDVMFPCVFLARVSQHCVFASWHFLGLLLTPASQIVFRWHDLICRDTVLHYVAAL